MRRYDVSSTNFSAKFLLNENQFQVYRDICASEKVATSESATFEITRRRHVTSLTFSPCCAQNDTAFRLAPCTSILETVDRGRNTIARNTIAITNGKQFDKIPCSDIVIERSSLRARLKRRWNYIVQWPDIGVYTALTFSPRHLFAAAF